MKKGPLLTSPLCYLPEAAGTMTTRSADGSLCCVCENTGMRRMRPEGLRGLWAPLWAATMWRTTDVLEEHGTREKAGRTHIPLGTGIFGAPCMTETE